MLKVLGAGEGSELEKTINRFSNQKDRIKKALVSFIEWKSKFPFNGGVANYPGYGSNDKKFKTFGKFGTQMPGISHAHLTHDISVVYQVDRETNSIKLFGVYTHDDIGTGSTPNTNRQEQMTQRWSNMKFDASQDPTALTTTTTVSDPERRLSGASRVDYTPKPKPQQIQQPKPQAPSQPDRTLQFANELEKLWPQRNIFNKLKQAKTKQEQMGVVNSEVAYLELIRHRNALYKNQQKYLEGLNLLFRYIASQSKM